MTHKFNLNSPPALAGGRAWSGDGAGKYATIFVLLIYTLIKAISLNTKRKQLPGGKWQTADMRGSMTKWAVGNKELAARPLT